MWTQNSIELAGHDGRAITNRLFLHGPPSERLTVIVAGFGYTIHAPYLFYSKQIPFTHGNEVLMIDFEYSTNERFLGLDEQGRDAWFHEEVDAVAAHLRDDSRYQRLCFIGKSLGTTTVFRLLQDEAIRSRTDGAVWLTPAAEGPAIADMLLRDSLPGLVVYGENDRYTKQAPLDALSDRANVDLIVVRDGDHALETGDPETSVEYLRRYVQRLNAFYDNSM